MSKTGKYNNKIPSKSRLNVKGYEWLKDEIKNTNFNKIKELMQIAESLNITPAQLAIIWCLKNKNVSSVILGASNLKQLKENLKSIDLYENIDLKLIDKI